MYVMSCIVCMICMTCTLCKLCRLCMLGMLGMLCMYVCTYVGMCLYSICMHMHAHCLNVGTL